MRAITNRLRRLEVRFVPCESRESALATPIRERRRLRFEKEGRPLVDAPREDLRGLTLAQVIRRHFRHRGAGACNELGANES
jgi:hypothetical protein